MVSVTTPQECTQLRNMHARVCILCLISSFITHKESASQEALLIVQGRVQRGAQGLEHPPKVWHSSQLSSCVTTIVIDKQQLVAETNNKLTRLEERKRQFLVATRPKTAFFIIKLSSRTR